MSRSKQPQTGLGPIMMDVRGLKLDADEQRQLLHPAVGGVILFTRNFAEPDQLAQLIGAIRRQRPELLIAADTEGGRVQRFREGFLRLPAAAQFGRLWQNDPQTACSAAQAGAWLLAAELRAMDIDLAFAPVLDIDTGSSGVIGDRAFASDPAAVTSLAQAFCGGMQAAGMATTGKHYPGHGFVVPDSHVELPQDERPAADIQQCDEQAYRALNNGLLDSVMMAHVRYPAVDEWPASISRVWIQQHLRGRLGFSGAVFSDDLSMGGLADFGDVRRRADLALQAGCDMLPVCNRPDDLSQLLDAQWHVPERPGAAARLAALRGKRHWSSLSELRLDPKYLSNINQINEYIQVKVE